MRTPAQRREWMVGHPVQGAIALGLTWGLLMAVVWTFLTGSDAWIFLMWVVLGLVLFGSITVVAMRRKYA